MVLVTINKCFGKFSVSSIFGHKSLDLFENLCFDPKMKKINWVARLTLAEILKKSINKKKGLRGVLPVIQAVVEVDDCCWTVER